MPLTCTVVVCDANDAPVVGAEVKLGSSQGSTDHAGRWSTSVADPALAGLLRVNHPYYATEVEAYAGDLRTESGANPLVRRTAAGSDVMLTVRLGRLDTCPTADLSADEIKRIMGTKARDPHVALLWRVPRFFPGVHGYRGHWDDIREVWRPDPLLLPDGPVDTLPAGWARFAHDTVKVDFAALGRFYWLEYAAQPSDPKYLVAVWSPNLANSAPLQSLDFVVFYSPHTGPYTATYPYGLINPEFPFQQYFDLGKKYLLDEFYFAFQLLARRNQAVLVMPICKAGDWGSFASGEAMLRLLREVALFLHRQARTSSLGVRPPTAGPEELAGPNLRRYAAIPLRSTDFGAVPAVGKIAIAGFSTGIKPVKDLMSDKQWSAPLGSTLWGVPAGEYADPRRAWTIAWRELWDLDGFHPETGGWRAYLDLLLPWFRADDGRVLRSYHSSSRVPPDPLTDSHPVWKYLRGRGIDVDRPSPPATGPLWARVLQNDRWTSLRMADAYVNRGPKGEQPPFLDAHHTTPRIGFPHAVSLTTVGRAGG